MSEAERGELAARIAADTQDVIAKATKNGMFVLPLTSNIAVAHGCSLPSTRLQCSDSR